MSWLLLYLLASALTCMWMLNREARLALDEWAELVATSLIWPLLPVVVPLVQRWHRRRWRKRMEKKGSHR